MPSRTDLPSILRPFAAHGLVIGGINSSAEALADCPFCVHDKKFYISTSDGRWQCKSCGLSGNATTFLRELWKLASDSTDSKVYDALRLHRGLLYPDTLIQWECVQSPLIDGLWLVPGYTAAKEIIQLYRYIRLNNEGKHKLIATPELHHGIYGMPVYNSGASIVYLCEGPWDGMALWETLGGVSADKDVTVLAVPGCNVFHRSWSTLFAGKSVVLLFDNDHPHGPNNACAAYVGMQRVVRILTEEKYPPKSIQYLKWGENGYDNRLASGYDIRDCLIQSDTVESRVELLYKLLDDRIEIVPNSWLSSPENKKSKIPTVELTSLRCTDWKVLVNAWRGALKWIDGLDRALSVMLASVLSTRSVGSQLWIKILGPASTGKSTLCEALSVSKKYVLAKSIITGFHSGYKTDKHGEEDNSLIVQMNDRTLVVKDADSILHLPNLGQIISEARDLYDGTSRTHYRNAIDRKYEGLRSTIILCGTSSLRQLDNSELGERFLDCVIMDQIDDALEDEVLWRVADRVDRTIGQESDGTPDSHYDQSLTKAMRLTGGYVEYLREKGQPLIKSVTIDRSMLYQCIQLGKFVAYMRARPSKKQEEKAEREFAARLVEQHIRLAKCLCVVLGKTSMDSEVFRRVRLVRMETARGRTLEIVKRLYSCGNEGAASSALAIWTGQKEESEKDLLRFLRKIQVVENFQTTIHGIRGPLKWKLTAKLAELYRYVISSEGATVNAD